MFKFFFSIFHRLPPLPLAIFAVTVICFASVVRRQLSAGFPEVSRFINPPVSSTLASPFDTRSRNLDTDFYDRKNSLAKNVGRITPARHIVVGLVLPGRRNMVVWSNF